MADPDEVIARGLRLLDLVICAVVLEGAKLILKNRDGTMERVEP